MFARARSPTVARHVYSCERLYRFPSMLFRAALVAVCARRLPVARRKGGGNRRGLHSDRCASVTHEGPLRTRCVACFVLGKRLSFPLGSVSTRRMFFHRIWKLEGGYERETNGLRRR